MIKLDESEKELLNLLVELFDSVKQKGIHNLDEKEIDMLCRSIFQFSKILLLKDC